ncbi:transmembrane protein 177 [Andrena cerasifolii]|uniref:transmembrane protein 177 n=1 Tax=Andrena cerasifolii TaxID=2819439 RepID=UPI0040382554
MSRRHLAVISATAVVVTGTLLPETVYLEKFRQLNAKYQWDQTEEPVKEKLQERFKKVLCDLGIPEKKKFKLFHTYGYNVYHGGSHFTKNGAVIGVPMHFNYENVENINKDEVFIYDKPIDWNKRAAKSFLNSLVLSENAQKFAMAREIVKIQQDDPVIRLMHNVLHIGLVYIIYTVIRITMKLPTRQKNVRYLVNSAFIGGGILSWVGTVASLTYETDVISDKKVSDLGPVYTQGGKEFYEKLLNRNIALRTLLGEDGKKLFTANGNENYMIFRKSAPIFHRKSFFDSKLEDVQQLV